MNLKMARKLFFMASAVVLLLTGLAKLFSAFGDAGLLTTKDPVFGIEFRFLMAAIGALEIAVALYCIKAGSIFSRAVVLLWLSSCFIIYRLGMWWVDYVQPCPCLGGLTDSLGISTATSEQVLKSIVALIWIGSLLSIADQVTRTRSLRLEASP